MTFIKIKHDDISFMTKDEKRFLVQRWVKLNRLTYRICAVYMALTGILALYGLAIILGNIIFLQGNLNTLVNIYPAILTICLVFLTAMIKDGERKGFILTLVAYLANTLSIILTPYYAVIVVLSIIPALFIGRSLANMPMVEELKKHKGYPYFTYTVAEVFNPQTYFKDEELHPADENYSPWNAFPDTEKVKGETDNDKNQDEA